LFDTIRINKTIPLHKQKSVKKALKSLLNNCLITPIDKSSNNIAFIYKRFYARVLAKELGSYVNVVYSPTYISCSEKEDEIVNKYKRKLKKSFKLHNEDESNVLPKMHWIPKMHKNPIKFRFIVVAVKCSRKPLAKSITSISSLITLTLKLAIISFARL